MSQNNKDRISIANIIAILGLAGIGVLSCFGELFRTADGKPGWPIIFGVLLAAVLGFFLFLAIKAKTAKDNLDKWRWVEYGSLVAYVLVAVFFASPFMGFWYILGERDAIQNQARTEITNIKNYYRQYDFQTEKYYEQAVSQLDSYLRSPQAQEANNTELAEYVQNYVSTLDDWRDIAKNNIKRTPDENLEQIEDKVEAFNILQLSSLASQLETARSDAKISIDKKLVNLKETNHLIPVINGGGGIKPYEFGGYAQSQFEFEAIPDSELRKLINDTRGFTALGIIVYIILNGLVLLNYLIAKRTEIILPVKERETKGLNL